MIPTNAKQHRFRDIAMKALGSCTPDEIQKVLDDAAKNVGGKIWNGIVQAMACGFGKGVLAMAAVIVLGGALMSGIGAWGGATAALAHMTFGQGFGVGLTAGLQSLFTGGGALTLGLGGILGSFMDVRRAQTRITADAAQAEARAYEMMRAQAQNQQRSNALSQSQAMQQLNFVTREMERRQQAAQGLAK